MKCKFSMISRLSIAAVAVALAWSAAAQNQAGSSSSLSEKDRAFMRKAAKGGKMEVAMGKMASERAQNADVKTFGERMVTDHSKANQDLESIAQKKGVQLPSKAPTETWKSDKDYMSAMIKDHEKDLAEFQKEASEGNDPDLKDFADRTAKVVQEHLNLAKETQSKLQ